LGVTHVGKPDALQQALQWIRRRLVQNELVREQANAVVARTVGKGYGGWK
jgi:hypothetical protein